MQHYWLFMRMRWIQILMLFFLAGAHAAVVQVRINPAQEKWTISPHLIGAHTVYYNDKDAAYADGELADWFRQAGIGTMRFPGGSVVKYWDWENPSGKATGDPWDPAWDGVVADSNNWMSLDEYLDFCDGSGIVPLVGVNYRSGYLYGRVQDSIDRAARCVQHVVDRGYPGAFYYIGNEDMFQVGGVVPAANLFVQHAQAMKAVDPAIKIFWNDNAADPQQMKNYLAVAGAWADGYEFHGKWPFGGDPDPAPLPGSYEEWKTEVPLIDRKANNNAGQNWRQKIADLRQAAIESGYPDLLLANNEYGWGKGDNFSGFNKFTSGLLMIDFLQEHFISGYDMACFWANIRGTDTGLLDKGEGYRRNPQALGWELLAEAQGATMVASTSSHPYVYGFTAKTDTEILVYMLNKTETNQTLNIVFQGLAPDAGQPPLGTAMVDTVDHWGTNEAIAVSHGSGTYSAVLPAMSYSRIRFMRSAAEPLFVADFDAAETNEAATLADLDTGTEWGAWDGVLPAGKGFIRASGTNHAVLVDRYGGSGFELDAKLTSAAPMDGLAVFFKAALRRTGAGKNISIQGRDGSGNKCFELEIDSVSQPTLGYVDPVDGFTPVPEGSSGDISFMNDSFSLATLHEVALYLYDSGYRISYEGGMWVSAELPYNGSAAELAQIRFSGNVDAGLWLDDVRVVRDLDSDGDGMPDHFELRYFGGPTNAVTDADGDHDGMDNHAESIAGTDPTNSLSNLKATGALSPDDRFTMEWDAVTGRVYSVYTTTDLLQPFTLTQSNLFYPQNVYTSAVDQAWNRFFRIQVERN